MLQIKGNQVKGDHVISQQQMQRWMPFPLPPQNKKATGSTGRWGSDIPLNSVDKLQWDVQIASKVYTRLRESSSGSRNQKSLALVAFRRKYNLLEQFTMFEKKHCDLQFYVNDSLPAADIMI
jgi:hypothetical protein